MDDVSTPAQAGSTTCTVYRNVAHPWSGEPGWDVMLIQSGSEGFLAACEKRGWQPWSIGESMRGSPRGVFFKPHQITLGHSASSWVDPSPWPEIPV